MAGEHSRRRVLLLGLFKSIKPLQSFCCRQLHGRLDRHGNGSAGYEPHQLARPRQPGRHQRARRRARRHLPDASRRGHQESFFRSKTGGGAPRRADDARGARPRAEEPAYDRAARLGAAAARSLPAEMAASHRRAGEDHLGGGGSDTSERLRKRVFPIDAESANPRHPRVWPSAAGGEARRVLRPRMQIVLFHLMPYADLDLEAGRKNGTVWVKLPNKHFDPVKGHRLYNRYLDELEYAEALGFDVVAVNEHHQTAYGLMPSPIVTASALARKTSRVKIAILGSALPLRSHPMMVAEEHAMIDVISGGRLTSGFVRGIGAEYHTFGVNPTFSHDRFHEAHDLIVRAWTEPGPFAFQGRHYNVQYVNLWPRPYQKPHPPIWIPSQGSKETIDWAAHPERRYTYLQTFSPANVVQRYLKMYRDTCEGFGYEAEDRQLGWAVAVYVAATDEAART